MSKQHWEIMHECYISDIYFWLGQIWSFKLMLRKHPDDILGDVFRDCIKRLKKVLAHSVADYEKIYGDKPNVRKMREEVEIERDKV